MGLYTPATGFAQTQYSDQWGTALPGQLVNASDINMCDAVTSYWPDSPAPQEVTAGSIVVVDYSGTDGAKIRKGTNTMVCRPVTAPLTAVQSLGVLVRTQQIATNENGLGTVYHQSECTVLRMDRVGGRVWVWVLAGQEPVNGARSAYAIRNGAFTALTTVAAGAQEVDGIIVHAVEPSVIYTDGTTGYKIALIELVN
jgi:hypothetical protein